MNYMRQLRFNEENRPDTNESRFIHNDEADIDHYEYDEMIQPRKDLEALQHFWKVNVK